MDGLTDEGTEIRKMAGVRKLVEGAHQNKSQKLMSIGAEATARNHWCMLVGELSRSLISRAQQLLCLSGSAEANFEA